MMLFDKIVMVLSSITIGVGLILLTVGIGPLLSFIERYGQYVAGPSFVTAFLISFLMGQISLRRGD